MTGFKDQFRLDCSLSRALQGMIKSSGESISEDVTLKARELAQRSSILRGSQIIWLRIDYFQDELVLARAVYVTGHRVASMARRRQAAVVVNKMAGYCHELVEHHS